MSQIKIDNGDGVDYISVVGMDPELAIELRGYDPNKVDWSIES